MFQFVPIYDWPRLSGRLVYRSSEHSFDFTPNPDVALPQWIGKQSTASISIDTLQIEVGVETEMAMFVWGYFPALKWKQYPLTPPIVAVGGVKITIAEGFQQGVTAPLSNAEHWSTKYDQATGWICIGEHRVDRTSQFIEFATGIVAALKGASLRAIWLYPNFE